MPCQNPSTWDDGSCGGIRYKQRSYCLCTVSGFNFWSNKQSSAQQILNYQLSGGRTLVNWVATNICKINLVQMDTEADNILERKAFALFIFFSTCQPAPWLTFKFFKLEELRPNTFSQIHICLSCSTFRDTGDPIQGPQNEREHLSDHPATRRAEA